MAKDDPASAGAEPAREAHSSASPPAPAVLTYEPALFDALTPNQQQFVLHPDVMRDPVKAMREIGFAESTAKARAHQWRKQLMYYIRPITEHRLAQAGVSLGRVKDELAGIAFAREPDYYDVVDIEVEVEEPTGEFCDGKPVMKLVTRKDTVKVFKDPALLPSHMAAAIKSIQFGNVIGPNGLLVGQDITRIELYEKTPALKILAEMLGGFDPKLRTPGDAAAMQEEQQLYDHLEPDELDQLAAIFERARLRMQKKASVKRDARAIEGKVAP